MSWTATLRSLTIGAGTSYRWATMPQGLGVTSRQTLVPLLGGGVAPTGRDVAEARDLTFEVHLLGDTPTTTQALIDALNAAWAPSGGEGVEELTLELATGGRVYRGRPLRSTIALGRIATGSIAQAQLVFVVTDPRWYSSTTQSVTVAVAGATGGMDTPMVTPMVTTGSGSSGDASVTNDGTAPAPWQVTLFGPLTTPRLILGGQTVQIDGDLAAGSIAVVDSRDGSVLVDGSPRPWVATTSEWWEIPTGASTFSFRAAAGTGTATLVWRDASY